MIEREERGPGLVNPNRRNHPRRSVMRMAIASVVLAVSIPVMALNSKNGWNDVAAIVIQRSTLTLPGGTPFHLEAEIVESTNPDSGYRAKVEEDWLSSEKWRRTIQSPDFSQTRIVNGDKIFEKNTGDYFPSWLNNLVTAIVDPLPGFAMPNPVDPQAEKYMDSRIANICVPIGPPGDKWTFCFDPSQRLITSTFNLHTGYGAEFKTYSKFGKKEIARQIVDNPEPGTTIEAQVTTLRELRQPDEAIFAIEKSTPENERIGRLRVSEDIFRQLSSTSTEIQWPAVNGGLLKGGCAVYVSADRSGQMDLLIK